MRLLIHNLLGCTIESVNTSRFVNRQDELEALEERWESSRAEFLVIYGRRRVGKSRLIARVSGRRIYEEQPLGSWRAVFAAFEELLDGGRILIALDEFQFAARRNAEIGSLINRLMNDRKGDGRLRLLIAGSDVSFFERDVVGYNATSYGRRTGSLRIEPFASRDIKPFLPGWTTSSHATHLRRSADSGCSIRSRERWR